MAPIIKRNLFLISILFVYFIICLYRLDSLPGEWFGDISNEHEYVSDILAGKWPWDFMQSTGPLYHYLITPVIWILGPSYLSYKIASVLMGGVGVVGIYLMALEFAGRRVAVFTSIVTVLSFWYIVWSRLGSSPQILSPVIVSWTLYFLLRGRHRVGGFFSGLGLISYPALFPLPLVTIVLVKTKRVFIGLIVPLMLFVLTFFNNAYADTEGYLKQKLRVQRPPLELLQKTAEYALRTMGSLHWHGDMTFRINIPGRPHLDVVSGGLWVVGLIVLFTKYRNKALFVIVPLLLLPIPSILPTAPAGEVPSSGRTFGMAPLVYLLVGLGMEELYRNLNRFKFLNYVIVILVGLGIGWFNLTTYFRDYPRVLPEQNSPYGRIIAEYIDTLPSNTVVRLTDCCWGKAGIPEPKAIVYSLRNPQTHQNIIHDPFIKTCEEVPNDRPLLLIFNPSDKEKIETFTSCFPEGSLRRQEVFSSLLLL